jgi:riboflavin kinase/FMN adenylyltransferase
MRCTWGLAGYRPPRDPVATIGNFDGLHRGHLALLAEVVAAARARGGTSVLLTFDPHPVTVLHPGVEFRFLTTLDDKLRLLERAGIDEIIFLKFDDGFAALTPEAFVQQVLVEALQVRELFVGQHFAFGKGRTGRIDDLRRLGRHAGILVHGVPPHRLHGQVVSSTRVRTLIQHGAVREAAELLGRVYSLGGEVLRGEARGRELGWPTANLRPPAERVIPADGVYAAIVRRGEDAFDAVSYIGTRPTFGAGERLIEVYLLDADLDLYGERLQVDFVDRLRGDETYPSAEALAAQIERDVQAAKACLRSANPVRQA